LHPKTTGTHVRVPQPTGGNDMELILWRHAEAEDTASSDLARQLTTRGRKHAQTVAKWLRQRLPPDATILASPTARTVQTVETLTDQYRTEELIAPGGTLEALLEAVKWPEGIASTVVVVGHQPTLGQVAARLVTGHSGEWTIKKGGLWWLAGRERGSPGRNGPNQVIVRAVISPDLV
jgi:phosphohistidine phosphatase